MAGDASIPSTRRPVSRATGIATLPPQRYIELSAETITGNVWQNLSIERYARVQRMTVLPVVVLDGHPAPGLAPVQETPDAGISRHVEYEFTWLAFALTALVLWIALNTRPAK